jgi:hypothetical protein
VGAFQYGYAGKQLLDGWAYYHGLAGERFFDCVTRQPAGALRETTQDRRDEGQKRRGTPLRMTAKAKAIPAETQEAQRKSWDEAVTDAADR